MNKKITICIENPETLHQIKKAFLSFFDRRAGLKLPNEDPNIIKLMRPPCKKPHDKINYQQIRQTFAEEMKKWG